MTKAKLSLAWQIVIGLILGIAVGALLNHSGADKAWWIGTILQPAGDLFIRLIKMIVIPIVISSLIVGIAGVGDGKKLGRIGFKTMVYFEVITTLAIIVGLVLANLFQPGHGIDMSLLGTTDISQYEKTTSEVQANHAFITTLLNLVPSNVFAAIVRGDMLPIIFFSVMFGLGLSSLKDELRLPLVNVLEGVSQSMFKVTHMIMRYAPLGVFALISVTVANFGFASLWPLARLVSLVYAAIAFFGVVVFGLVARACGFSVFKLMRILKAEMILGYSTASSETVLPRIIEKMEAYGAPRAISRFVVPTGYSFNLDGSTLYQSIAAVFIAQLYGIDLSLGQQVTLVLTLMVTSKGIAGVPGVSFVVLLATLGSVGIPLEGLAFIAGVDRIMDMARTALNIVGNALAVLVVARWEGMYDDTVGERYWKSLSAPQPGDDRAFVPAR
ncbi:glutamate/aspartate:proton symporter GltP [Pseudomonas gingeri]|uniref:Glutamate/aspartate:proton symporter GltP n=1 Tax=Pseudomonas gingeri TaxID=117681 RepID=A0A7Y7YC86_9PSED|nr:glutamate/aspartate:proton symporter GltP [Pseudomonas gingeri]NVZ99411.1 glutamate/aspartate:proton symporter GltP [Pseudomonas gingeri]NWA13456.1 glutamate/aspartate:proton symporter GltP [Pseudomonas gingeri]NWA55717.1 glutamate/aspartate:proton symporter GltP [Pseudomonas gingeri]NWA95429.1 glutamate/aspartate:proton symporter GltP [Pseudomonas gingeri]NWB00516.1 glutamate/aspartate:proton symporter GltP [Pseudomonas gingeri]